MWQLSSSWSLIRSKESETLIDRVSDSAPTDESESVRERAFCFIVKKSFQPYCYVFCAGSKHEYFTRLFNLPRKNTAKGIMDPIMLNTNNVHASKEIQCANKIHKLQIFIIINCEVQIQEKNYCTFLLSWGLMRQNKDMIQNNQSSSHQDYQK